MHEASGRARQGSRILALARRQERGAFRAGWRHLMEGGGLSVALEGWGVKVWTLTWEDSEGGGGVRTGDAVCLEMTP